MSFPISVTFRDIGHSDSVEEQIRRKAEKLGRLFSGIIRCDVAIEAPHRHHLHGNHYRVRLHLALAGETLVVGGKEGVDPTFEDLHAAVELAFDQATRMIVERGRHRRARIHEQARNAQITK
jgi:ribosome-associated translation inhibitor RaiA